MIYNPTLKTRSFPLSLSGSGGFSVSIDTDMVGALETATADPAAFADRVCRLVPRWATSPSFGSRTIKYTTPEGSILRRIRSISSQISSHIKAKSDAYRSMKNRAMKLIRESCEVDVPVFKYVRTWRVKDVTYIKKVKLPVAAAAAYENSGTLVTYGTSDYERLLQLSKSIGPFDKTRTVRFEVSKTFGYWANVKTFVRNRKVIKDRSEYDKRRADWVNKNPPYRASKDSVVSQMRQEVINLKLQMATRYNQCIATVSAGVCGTPNECWDAAYTMLAQYLLPSGICTMGNYALFSYFGRQSGFLVKVERLASGSETSEPNWYTTYDQTEMWHAPERSITVQDSLTNREMGQSINPTANAALDLIESRAFSVGALGLGYKFRAAYDRAALNLAAGGGNPFEWNFARSFAELKDTRQTVATARDFLQKISGGKFKAATTIAQAARLYLTYQYGIAPTADEIGTLLGTSRSLLKHTYPMLRTLNAYAQGVVTASLTGRQLVQVDETSIVDGLFPDVWDQVLSLGTVSGDLYPDGGSMRQTISLSNYGIFNNGARITGADKTVSGRVWAQVESAGVAPKWVWLPEKPLVFCKYDAKKIQDSLGTSFADILASLDAITTGWELLPLSFVVDWFTNLRSSFQAMDAFVRADRLDLSPNGEGPWHSTRFRLCLATPIFRKKGGTREYHLWYSGIDERTVEASISDGTYRGTFYTPQGASMRIRALRHGVNVIRSDVFAYARDLMEGAPLLALLPEIKVSLNASKLSSLLAILLSSGR